MRFASRLTIPFVLGVVCAAAPLAAQKPAGATGTCKDGSFTTATTKAGACSGHGGVKEWSPPAPAQKATKKKASEPKSTAAAKAPAKPAPAPATVPAKPAPTPAPAKAPATKTAPVAGAPAAATAQCNDGTFSESQHRSGACSNHKGVKQWLKTIPPA